MVNLLQMLIGDPNQRQLNKLKPYVALINSLEEEYQALSDEELQGKTGEFKQRLEKGEDLNDLLPEAFALVREASKRVLGLRHFDVQLMGGIVLHRGQIAEMKTGEGKTLVATLPCYLNALTGKGVQVVTVNDYLARRDAEWMGQVHRFLGLTVGLIQQPMDPIERQRNYSCDITYVTNSELGFDYLRDNMATSMEEVVQRPFHYCVIDEVDSILIDEARTPLIISGQVERPTEKYMTAAKIVAQLEKDKHYEVDEKQRNIILTDEGFEEAERLLQVKDLFDQEDPWAHYVFNAIKAKELFIKDVNYIVRNDEVVIVDEFTGRVMPGRKWSDGLHQAIEAKENVPIEPETQTLASITYQNLFLLYPKLSGMTGTAKTEEAEFSKIYNLEVTVIPTNKKNRRLDYPDEVYKTEAAKWRAVARECQEMYAKGRPVLVGTTSVEKSEYLSRLLHEMGIPHNLLNAKPENVEREAEIIAQAGRKGTITIATNMAGRGTDIILGGNADYMARLKIREELFPRLVKPEDDSLMQRSLFRDRSGGEGFGTPKRTKTWKASAQLFPAELTMPTQLKFKEALDYVVTTLGAQSLTELQAEDLLAIAVEKSPTTEPVVLKLREIFHLIRSEYEQYTKQEQKEVIELGGLHVIGTERHESRRIDNQLRGRCARQGDPGSTKFFLSLEDNLMRIFGGDRVASLMNAFRVEEDMPITSGLLTSSLEGAQKKVETYYYDIRKQVFEYDEVMNKQRRAIYAERYRVLKGENLRDRVMEYAEQTVEDLVNYYINPDLPPEEWNLEGLVNKTKEFVKLLKDLHPDHLMDMNVEQITAYLKEEVRRAYEIKEAEVDSVQPGLMRQAERFYILQQIDTLWREHLQSMEALRESVGLRGYGQKDPLIEYKTEGFDLFFAMMTDIRRNVVFSLFEFDPRPPQTTGEIEVEVV